MGTYAKVFEALLTSQRASGVTLSGGKVYFYVPGSVTTYKAIYADRGKQTPAANPYTLNSDGAAAIYGDGLYDIVLKTAAGATVATWEDVSLVDISGDETSIVNYADLAAAVAAIGATKTTLVVSTDQAVTADLTIPSTMAVKVVNEALITVSSTKVLTINGPFEAPPVQCFAGAGSVVFGTGVIRELYVEWTGAIADGTTDNTAALNKIYTIARASRTVSQTPIPVSYANTAVGYRAIGPIFVQDTESRGNGTMIIHDGGTANYLFSVISTSGYHSTEIHGFDFRSLTNTSTGKCIVLGTIDNSALAGGINVDIHNNTWYRYSGTAIYAPYLDSGYIHHNHFVEGLNGYAIHSMGDVETGVAATTYVFNGITISNNRINSHDRFTATGFQAIKADGTVVTIENNMIIGSAYGAILTGYRSQTYNVAILNNYFESNGPYHVSAGTSNGTYTVRGLVVNNNRMPGGIVDPAMTNAVVLNSVYGGKVNANYINTTPAAPPYNGYTAPAITAVPAYCRNIEIVNNSLEDDTIANFIDPSIRTIPGLLVKHWGAFGEYAIDGQYYTQTVAASLTPAGRFDIAASGSYQVDLMVRGNGISGADNIAGSWLVLFDYVAGASIISVQAIGVQAKVGAITSLGLTAQAAGNACELDALLTQTNNTTARFDWHIKMMTPYHT